jgi:hypothetical protein
MGHHILAKKSVYIYYKKFNTVSHKKSGAETFGSDKHSLTEKPGPS